MPADWSLYETVLGNTWHTDRRGVVIEQAVHSFMSGVVDDPAYQPSALVNNSQVPIVASRTSTIECSIKAPPNTDIHIGDMVECFDEHWIVVELYKDKVGMVNGKMWLCNNVIRFQNFSSLILSRHCVVDDGTYSKKSSDPDAAIMTNTYRIYLPIDDATRKFFVDKRLSLGQIYSSRGEKILEVYKIIGIDVKSKNFGRGSHLMVLTVQRDVYDPQADSLVESICDIIVSENDDITNKPASKNCTIIGRDTIRLGTSRKYTAVFTDADGKNVTITSPFWSIEAPAGISYKVIDGNCIIDVPLNEKFVGETITIFVAGDGDEFGNYEKKVQVITIG